MIQAIAQLRSRTMTAATIARTTRTAKTPAPTAADYEDLTLTLDCILGAPVDGWSTEDVDFADELIGRLEAAGLEVLADAYLERLMKGCLSRKERSTRKGCPNVH